MSITFCPPLAKLWVTVSWYLDTAVSDFYSLLSIMIQDSELQSLPLLLSNIAKPAPSEMQTSIVIEQEDGTEKHIILATSQTDRSVDNSTAAGKYFFYLASACNVCRA